LVGLLAAAFIMFVAAKGRLPVYTAVLWGKTADGSKAADKGGGVSTGDAVKLAAQVAPYVLA
jgi:hypothetical protein